MAHLPPKIPNWPDHNGFLGFSSARRGLHRRSVSDSIAFLDTPMMMMTQNLLSNNVFDEEQFRSMLSDHHQIIPPNEDDDDDQPTSSDDHNSNNEKDAAENDDQKHQLRDEEPKDEVQSRQCNNAATNYVSKDRITDPKRVKRILANRQSARRSRVRKLQYITELERSVSTLQAEVSMLSPRVAFLDQQRLFLNVDNTALKQRIATLSQDKIFKDAHEEALKREIERLGELYHQQQQQNHDRIMECNNGASSPVVTKEPTSPLFLLDIYFVVSM